MKKKNQRSGFFRAHRRAVWRQLHRVSLAVLLAAAPSMWSQGMPPEARKNIHSLFNGHDHVQRELKLTDDGYEAVTQSDDEGIAAALKEHVQQMQERLDSGRAARRWDPAFAEYRAYYDQIDLTIEKTETGVKVIARGKTPEAVKVAQNHASVINQFVQHGWSEHEATHPAVLTPSKADAPAAHPTAGWARGRGQCGGEQCCRGCGRGLSAPTSN